MIAIAPAASAAISFNFQSRSVRVVMRNDEPWFVAFDICEALGYANSRKAVADHLDDDERSTVTNSDSRNGGGKLTIINESGLYALVLRSRKPQARKFAKWVTSEVLPSIRKIGQYTTQPELEFDAANGYLTHRKQMRELISHYVNWAHDARQMMKSAGLVPPEWPQELDDEHAIAQAVVADLLRQHRWMLDFDHELKLRLTPVSAECSFIAPSRVADWIADDSFPSQHLPAVVRAVADRLAGAAA